MKVVKGIIAVPVTPFLENHEFDYEGAKKNLDWLISKGVHGLCILGATGEYQSITTEEHKEYVEQMMAYINGRVPVIVGATRERTADVIDLLKHAKDNGGTAGMVLPPYYCKPTQEEIYTHYKNINDAVDFPVVVYNNPHSAGVDISHETMCKIAELPNMTMLKESTGDLRRTTAATMELSDKIVTLCGWENLCYEAFAAGAEGWICVLANIAPEMCIELYNSVAVKKDINKGYELYRDMLPALNFLEGFPKYIQLLKYILEKKGLAGGYTRQPRLELTEEEKEIIDESIDINLLY